jgi:hypothetical protein
VTGEGGHCWFCGATGGPFAKVEGLFTVWICIPCLEVRQAQPATGLGRHDPGPYPLMTRSEMRESLALLPSWVLAQKASITRFGCQPKEQSTMTLFRARSSRASS